MINKRALTATDIKRLLRRKGITQKHLANKYGKSEMTISRVIRAADGDFQCISDPLMRAISCEIGVDPEIAFNKYYTWDGRRPRKSPAIINN